MIIMPTVKIKITATSKTDPYVRIHGKAVDEDLNYTFWDTQPEKVIGRASGKFSHTQEVNLTLGDHFVTYSNSGYHYNPWHGKIYVNGKLIGEGNVYRSKPLKVQFTVTGVTPTPPLKKKVEGPLGIWKFPVVNMFLTSKTQSKAKISEFKRSTIKTY